MSVRVPPGPYFLSDLLPVDVALGATRVDIGQGEQSWVVMADPEGNEFCVA